VKVSLDLDGVVCDFTTYAVAAGREMFPNRFPDDYESRSAWSFNDILSDKEWKRLFAHMKGQKTFWLNLPPYQDALDALEAYMEKAGHDDLYFVTSRGSSSCATAEEQTEDWLFDNYLPAHHLIVVTHAEDKAAIIAENGIQFSLDDLPATVRACNAIPGHSAFLLDRPYNREDTDLPRVFSVREFLEKVTL
jgi:uncharacterized HAD superfamily protein